MSDVNHDPAAESARAPVSRDDELGAALEDARQSRLEVDRLRQELEDTNRGVLALYAELDDQSKRLRDAHEHKSRFTSALSHELRTPLNSIQALSRLLLQGTDGDLTAEQHRQVAFIQSSAQSLRRLVDDVLDLARAEAGRMPVEVGPVTLGELFRSLSALLRPLARDEVSLVVERPRGIPTLRTDEGKLAQILRNLGANALKFTYEGEVRIEARLIDEGREVLFLVRDTGVGIARADAERVFDEFVQVGGPAADGGGSGLGLPLARRLAELLGGRLWLEDSVPGEGSTFAVALPAEVATPEVHLDAARPAGSERAHVLVVEDDEATRYVLTAVLHGAGFSTSEAGRAASGERMALSEAPDAIVLDLQLPDGSGRDALMRLRADAATADTPVVVYTAADLESDETALLERHGATIVRKGDAAPEDVVEVVRGVLGARPGSQTA